MMIHMEIDKNEIDYFHFYNFIEEKQYFSSEELDIDLILPTFRFNIE